MKYLSRILSFLFGVRSDDTLFDTIYLDLDQDDINIGTTEKAISSGIVEADWDEEEMALRLITCERKNIHDKHYIYGLYNHGTRRIFYIGRTNNLFRRLKQHVETANSRGTFKERYIARMLSENIPPHDIPSMVIVEECTRDEAINLEKYWIRVFEDHDMTNLKVG